MVRPAQHVWFELVTSDQDAAEAFYADVVGWRMADAGMPGFRYTLASFGEARIAGIMAMPGAPPAWLGYVAVDDVDGDAAKVAALGGAVHKPAEDIPGVGRFAVVADPQGAAFVLFKGLPADPAMPQLPPMATGSIGWHELYATDWEAVFPFYAELLGWEKDEALDMGPMGTYQLFRAGGNAIGGMMNNPNVPRPMWLYYFVVDDIDAGKARLEAAGGTVMNGPMEVPGGAWVVQARDPQGAMFALVGMRAVAAGATAG